MTSSNNSPKPRRRARKSDGTFKGDIPGTKQNEAWESTDISTEVKDEKEVVKPIVQEVDSTSQKYSPKPKVRPTFGKVRSISH